MICLRESEQLAHRAGTPGFRAPEVLLKYLLQTSGIKKYWQAIKNKVFLVIKRKMQNFSD